MDDRAALNAHARIVGGVASEQAHDSARKHVSGEAVYVDDMPAPAGLLHAYLGLAEIARGRIRAMDVRKVRAAPGVVEVLTAADIPGVNDVSPVGKHDDPVFAGEMVEFHGQPLFAVIARSRDQARAAARLAKIKYEPLPALIDIEDARHARTGNVTEPLTLKRGDAAAGLKAAKHRVKGQMRIGGQDHFYLEGQIALAMPGEDEDVLVYSSTQHPSEVQHIVSLVLGVASHAVTVEVRRIGGGFGVK